MRDILRLRSLHCVLGDEEEPDEGEASGDGGGTCPAPQAADAAATAGKSTSGRGTDDAQAGASTSGRRGGAGGALHEAPPRALSLGEISEEQRSQALGRRV